MDKKKRFNQFNKYNQLNPYFLHKKMNNTSMNIMNLLVLRNSRYRKSQTKVMLVEHFQQNRKKGKK